MNICDSLQPIIHKFKGQEIKVSHKFLTPIIFEWNDNTDDEISV